VVSHYVLLPSSSSEFMCAGGIELLVILRIKESS
jgi:hypothetical protein